MYLQKVCKCTAVSFSPVGHKVSSDFSSVATQYLSYPQWKLQPLWVIYLDEQLKTLFGKDLLLFGAADFHQALSLDMKNQEVQNILFLISFVWKQPNFLLLMKTTHQS
jgi:hypothetical protein